MIEERMDEWREMPDGSFEREAARIFDALLLVDRGRAVTFALECFAEQEWAAEVASVLSAA